MQMCQLHKDWGRPFDFAILESEASKDRHMTIEKGLCELVDANVAVIQQGERFQQRSTIFHGFG
jgi:hypothetical protein